MKPRVLSLFAGIGGFDLGLERAGMQTVGQCEIEPYCQRVLRKHWPNVWLHDDVRTLTGSLVAEKCGSVDVICGGYPCQPFSLAGKRGGTNDPRHLWPEYARIIREVRPRIALLENVPGHLSMGFGDVLGDLAEAGYDAEWAVFPASALGAWHRRERIFVVAYSQQPRGSGGKVYAGNKLQPLEAGEAGSLIADGARQQDDAPDADSDGCGYQREGHPEIPVFRRSRSQRQDGAGGIWATESAVGRVAYGVPRRVDRLRGLGNAIVPQVAEYVGRCVMGAFFK